MMLTAAHRRVACLVASLIVHGAQPTGARQDRPSFRSSARLVEVSVVVMDRNRNPVSGLTASDFEILDDGKPQKVEFFAIEGSAGTAAVPTAAASQRAGEFSNKVADAGSVTVILYDQFNTPLSVRLRARDHVARFLEQIRPDDRVGLYVLDSSGALRVVHDFTSDAASLVRAVARVRGGASAAAAGAEDSDVLAQLEAELNRELGDGAQHISGAQAMKEHFIGLQGTATIDALESIGRYMSGMQNRKNLIWVSAGFPLSAFDYRGKSKTSEINRATRALNDANVALYTVDARGLLPALTGVPGQQTFTTLSMVAGNQDILQSAAEGTGGRAFLNTNDIQGAIRRAADDARMTYVLGYYPTSDVWDGRFHRIGVKVRRPGIDVRHRKGYFAVATPKQAAAQRSAALQAAVVSPINASGLGLTVRVDPIGGKPSEYRLTMHIEAGAIALEPVGPESHGAIDVVVAQIRADGAEGRSMDHTVNIRAAGERLEQLLRDGTTVTHTITLHPEAARLRVVVRDVRTGAIGAVGVSRQQLQGLAR